MVSPYPVSKIPCPVPGADFFEPGSKIPLPRSPGADFFETGSRNPPPQGAKRPGGAAEDGARGIFEPVSKNQPRGMWGGMPILENRSNSMLLRDRLRSIFLGALFAKVFEIASGTPF